MSTGGDGFIHPNAAGANEYCGWQIDAHNLVVRWPRYRLLKPPALVNHPCALFTVGRSVVADP